MRDRVNKAPVITGPTSVSIDENTTPVLGIFIFSDPEGDSFSPTISPESDLYQILSAPPSVSGEGYDLTLVSPLRYNTNVGGKNTYTIKLTASDLFNETEHILEVTVNDPSN